jgi:transcriptional regulator with XRE-family HTH domain
MSLFNVVSKVLLAVIAKLCYSWKMHTNLDQDVLSLLQSQKGDWLAIARDSGVSYSWLSKFSNGHISNPGFATLLKLHKVLAPVQVEKKANA